MSTVNQFTDPHHWWGDLSRVLKSLQTWWLLLTGLGLVLCLLLLYANHRGAPDVERIALLSAAAIFLAGMILSTLHTERHAQGRDDPFIWMARIRCMMAIGIAVIVSFAAAHADKNEHPVAIATIGVLCAGAAWIAGILLGFIFGLPQPAKIDNRQQSNDSRSENDQTKTETHAPTNLEQIADWLTKLILGAGLTQIGKIPHQLNLLASYIGKGMGDEDAYKLLALSICIYFFSCGFLFGYLWGRLFMPDAFRLIRHRDTSRNRNLLGI